MKIVFDTNVLFSAFVSHGVCSGLYEECLLRAEMIVSPAILKELEEKLIGKAKLTKSEARQVIAAVRSDARIVPDFSLPEPVCRDADDDCILGVGLSSMADAIVTEDQDLLVIKRFQGIPIVTPRECLAMLQSD